MRQQNVYILPQLSTNKRVSDLVKQALLWSTGATAEGSARGCQVRDPGCPPQCESPICRRF